LEGFSKNRVERDSRSQESWVREDTSYLRGNDILDSLYWIFNSSSFGIEVAKLQIVLLEIEMGGWIMNISRSRH
jgi:hypothetical protein